MTLVSTDRDDLTRQADELEAAVSQALTDVADTVAARIGAVTVAAADDPPGEPFVSLDDLTLITSQWSAQVAGRLVPFLEQVYLGASVAWTLTLSKAAGWRLAEIPKVTTEAAREHVRHAANRLRGIGDLLWESARRELLDGFTAGDSIPDLAGRVRRAANVAGPRAVTIARTEVVSASNAGSHATARLLGVDMKKQWEATNDTRTRESHRLAHGQAVTLAEPFTVGGAALQYPGDPVGPPEEVINCRCTVTYDVPDPEPVTASVTAVASGETERQWHLPGRHDQKKHGNRYAKPGDKSSGLRLPGGVKINGTNLTGKLDDLLGRDELDWGWGTGHADGVLTEIARRQGFDAKPTIVDDADIDRMIDGGAVEMRRGLKQRSQAEAFLGGDYWAGQGHVGNGTYMAAIDRQALAERARDEYLAGESEDDLDDREKRRLQRDMDRAVDRALRYADAYAGAKSIDEPSVLRMALRPDAKVIKYGDLHERMKDALRDGYQGDGGPTAADNWDQLIRDEGRFAAVLGYDAVDVSSVAPGEFLLLNRSAVYASGTIHDPLE